MLRKIQQDIAALDLDRETLDDDVGIEIVGAGAAIEFPGVPGAHQRLSVQSSVAERSASVGAEAVESVQFAVHVANGVGAVPHVRFHNGPRRKLGERRDFDEGHIVIVQSVSSGGRLCLGFLRPILGRIGWDGLTTPIRSRAMARTSFF